MREDKTTQVEITVELMGKQVALTQAVSNHELEEGIIWDVQEDPGRAP